MEDTHHLLYPAFLERRELGSPGLHVQLTLTLVLLAHLADAGVEGRDLATLDVLEDFGAARVACVRVHLQERLDLGDASDDAADGDELSEVGAANLADGEDGLFRERAEVEVAAFAALVSHIFPVSMPFASGSLTIVGGVAAGTQPGRPPHSGRSCYSGGIESRRARRI